MVLGGGEKGKLPQVQKGHTCHVDGAERHQNPEGKPMKPKTLCAVTKKAQVGGTKTQEKLSDSCSLQARWLKEIVPRTGLPASYRDYRNQNNRGQVGSW